MPTALITGVQFGVVFAPLSFAKTMTAVMRPVD